MNDIQLAEKFLAACIARGHALTYTPIPYKSTPWSQEYHGTTRTGEPYTGSYHLTDDAVKTLILGWLRSTGQEPDLRLIKRIAQAAKIVKVEVRK